MKTLTLNDMELLKASGYFSGFCNGFTATSVVYGGLIAAGLATGPTPMGAVSWAIVGINAACLFA